MGGKRGAILEGSSRSGKTWSSVDFIILLCVSAKEPITINIIKETYKSFKTTLYDDFNRRMPAFGLVSPFANRQEVSSFKLFGSKINLLGADSDSVMHGVSCDYLYMNEMLDIPQAVFDQAEMRCRKFWWGDYNPKFTKHWIYDKVCKRPDVSFLKTTYLDNPAISEQEKSKILSYEPTHPEDRTKPEAERRPHPTNIANGTADDYMWNVYGLGVRSAPEGLVFQHVTWIDKFPTNIEHVYYGSDIGYTNSPSTLVRVGRDGQNLYLELLHYGPTPSSNEYIPILRKHNPNGTTWSDSAEPGYIMDSRRAGLKVMPVNKFPGSINYGVSLLKKFKIHIVECDEWKEEQSNYKYREINGIKLDEPIDDFNHCFQGDTMITTSTGRQSIKSIQPGDMVLTSTGFQEVFEVFNNGIKLIHSYSLQFDTVTVSLQCTPDHKIKTDKGWVEISKLKSGMTVYLANYLQGRFTDCTQAKSISPGEVKRCIGRFGKLHTGRGQMGTTSTTKMETHGTITGLTSNYRRVSHTYQNTVKSGLKRILNGLKGFIAQELRLQKHGMQVLMDSNGIHNTVKKGGKTGHTLTSHAKNAGQLSVRVTPELPNTVIITAKLKRFEEGEGKHEQVYDLAVMNTHEYVANGLLVSNCWDAARYAVMSNLR